MAVESIFQEDSPGVRQLLKELCRQYAVAREWTTEDLATKGRLRDFVEWCRSEGLPEACRDRLEEVGFSRESIDFVAEVLRQDDFTVAAYLLPLQDTLFLAGRGPVSPKPLFMAMTLRIYFEGDQLLPLFVPAKITATDQVCLEGDLLSVIAVAADSLRHTLREAGISESVKTHGRPMSPEDFTTLQSLQNLL